MKDLKEKLKRRISEMLDADGLTAEDLNYLTDAYCKLASDVRMSAMAGLPLIATGAAFGRREDDDDDE